MVGQLILVDFFSFSFNKLCFLFLLYFVLKVIFVVIDGLNLIRFCLLWHCLGDLFSIGF